MIARLASPACKQRTTTLGLRPNQTSILLPGYLPECGQQRADLRHLCTVPCLLDSSVGHDRVRPLARGYDLLVCVIAGMLPTICWQFCYALGLLVLQTNGLLRKRNSAAEKRLKASQSLNGANSACRSSSLSCSWAWLPPSSTPRARLALACCSCLIFSSTLPRAISL